MGRERGVPDGLASAADRSVPGDASFTRAYPNGLSGSSCIVTAVVAELGFRRAGSWAGDARPGRCDVIAMNRDFNADDEGKAVLTADGDMVGTVESTDGDSAHVRPDENLSRATRQKLGWTAENEETYRLESSNVERITGDEIHLTASD